MPRVHASLQKSELHGSHGMNGSLHVFITVLICAWELRQQVVDQLASVSEHWLGCVTCVTHVVVALLEADQLQPQQPASPRGGDKMGREEKRREAKRREEKRREGKKET